MVHLIFALSGLLPLFGASVGSVTVPDDFVKISNDLVKIGTTYFRAFAKNNKNDFLAIDRSLTLVFNPPFYKVFDNESYPNWSDDTAYLDPDVNMIGEKMVRLYFAAVEKSSGLLAIGVAFSDSIDDPAKTYLTLNKPLISNPKLNCRSQTLIIQSGKPMILAYVGGDKYGIFATLSDDGFSVVTSPKTIFEVDQDWEAGKISNLRNFERNGYIYIMYDTGAEGTVGVVRSREATGPYEKIPTPLILTTRELPNVTGQNIRDNLLWGEDDWPYWSL